MGAIRSALTSIFVVFSCLQLSPYTFAESTMRKVVVEVVGLEGKISDNVKAHLGVHTAQQKKRDLTEYEARQLYARAAEEASSALQAFGYYAPRISTHFAVEQYWEISISVVPGAQTELRNVDIQLSGEGRDDPLLLALVDKSKLQTSLPLLHEAYSRFKTSLEKTAYGLGYLDARYEVNQINVYPEIELADVTLHFNTGSLYSFGPIEIQQDALDPAFVERYIIAKEGDPFKSASLLSLQLRLSETNYFDSLRIEVMREEAVDNHIPVVIIATAKKRSAYDFKVGFGTDTGPRMGIEADYRRLNRLGHRFRNQAELSAQRSTAVSQYVIPVDEVSSEYFDVTATVEQEEINDVDSAQYRLGSSLNEARWGGRSRVALEYLAEDWSIGDQDSQTTKLLVPSLEFTHKTSNDAFFPTHGFSYTARVLAGAEGVLSDVSFAQVQLYAKAVLPVAKNARVLLRADFFATETDNFDALPPSLRFYAGGAQSVRGYGYKDLSPQDRLGNLVGGQYQATVSTEFDFLVRDNLGFAVFVDAGDATEEPFQSFKVGAGLGFRYRSPVGMLRLDVAHAFDDAEDDYRIHLSFGVDL